MAKESKPFYTDHRSSYLHDIFFSDVVPDGVFRAIPIIDIDGCFGCGVCGKCDSCDVCDLCSELDKCKGKNKRIANPHTLNVCTRCLECPKSDECVHNYQSSEDKNTFDQQNVIRMIELFHRMCGSADIEYCLLMEKNGEQVIWYTHHYPEEIGGVPNKAVVIGGLDENDGEQIVCYTSQCLDDFPDIMQKTWDKTGRIDVHNHKDGMYLSGFDLEALLLVRKCGTAICSPDGRYVLILDLANGQWSGLAGYFDFNIIDRYADAETLPIALNLGLHKLPPDEMMKAVIDTRNDALREFWHCEIKGVLGIHIIEKGW